MALCLIYVMLTKLLGWIVLRARTDTTKEIEILVLVGAENRVTPSDQRLRRQPTSQSPSAARTA